MEKITRDMTVGDIVEKYPQAAEIFLEYGLHCVGCHVATWETIEEGARGHGMMDEEIDMMLSDANKVAQQYTQTPKNGIQVTDAALNRVKEMAQKMKKTNYVFRIGIAQGGCSGHSYTFAIEEKEQEDDMILPDLPILVVIDKKSFDALNGSTIDYIDTLSQSGFKVHNPQASQTCGCGSSFS